MALKYLEARIAAQGTGIVAIFLGSLYYNKKDKRELITQQPFGPYKHGYGKTHHTKSNLESVMGYWVKNIVVKLKCFFVLCKDRQIRCDIIQLEYDLIKC